MYLYVAGLGECEHVFKARVDWTSLIKDMCVNVCELGKVLWRVCLEIVLPAWGGGRLSRGGLYVSVRVIVCSVERHPLHN